MLPGGGDYRRRHLGEEVVDMDKVRIPVPNRIVNLARRRKTPDVFQGHAEERRAADGGTVCRKSEDIVTMITKQ